MPQAAVSSGALAAERCGMPCVASRAAAATISRSANSARALDILGFTQMYPAATLRVTGHRAYLLLHSLTRSKAAKFALSPPLRNQRMSQAAFTTGLMMVLSPMLTNCHGESSTMAVVVVPSR